MEVWLGGAGNRRTQLHEPKEKNERIITSLFYDGHCDDCRLFVFMHGLFLTYFLVSLPLPFGALHMYVLTVDWLRHGKCLCIGVTRRSSRTQLLRRTCQCVVCVCVLVTYRTTLSWFWCVCWVSAQTLLYICCANIAFVISFILSQWKKIFHIFHLI